MGDFGRIDDIVAKLVSQQAPRQSDAIRYAFKIVICHKRILNASQINPPSIRRIPSARAFGQFGSKNKAAS